jgi:hypothetical protein
VIVEEFAQKPAQPGKNKSVDKKGVNRILLKQKKI